MKALRSTAIIVVVLTGLGVLWKWIWIPLEANREKKRAEAAITAAQNSGSTMDMAFLVQKELPNLERLIRLMPNDVDLLAEKAAMLRLVKRRAEAAETYRAAIEREGRPEFYLNLARVLADMDRDDEAVDALEVVARFDRSLVTREWSPSIVAGLQTRLAEPSRPVGEKQPESRRQGRRGPTSQRSQPQP